MRDKIMKIILLFFIMALSVIHFSIYSNPKTLKSNRLYISNVAFVIPKESSIIVLNRFRNEYSEGAFIIKQVYLDEKKSKTIDQKEGVYISYLENTSDFLESFEQSYVTENHQSSFNKKQNEFSKCLFITENGFINVIAYGSQYMFAISGNMNYVKSVFDYEINCGI